MFKTYDDFKNAVKCNGIVTAEAEFTKSQNTPFLVYFRSGNNNICADGKVVVEIPTITAELYTDKNDNESETKFENWLKENIGAYEKTERIWISEEKFYLTEYKFEIILND